MRLQGKFLVTIIPSVAIALLSLGALVYFQMLATNRALLEGDINMALERVELHAANIVDIAESNVVLLADSAQIASYFALSDERRADPRSGHHVESLFRKLRLSHPHYREVRLLSRDGAEIVRRADKRLPNHSRTEAGSDWFADLGTNWGQSVHTSVMPHAEDGVLSVTVSRPVKVANADPRLGSSLQGFVVLNMRVDAIGELVNNGVVGHDGYIAMVDDQGGIVYAPESQVEHAQRVSDALQSSQATESSESRLTLLKTDDQSYNVGSAALVDGVKTLVVIPGSVVAALSSEIGKIVALVTLAAIVGFGVLFTALVRSVVIRPIKGLKKNFVALGEGRPTLPSIVERDDEIGDLAASFNTMSEKLSDSMSELRDSHARIEALAYEDGLTGLANRRRFLELLSSAAENQATYGQQLALLFIDLDGFKRLNDVEGHRAGDQLLVEIARRTVAQVENRRSRSKPAEYGADIAARIGGDEFVLLLNGVDGEPDASLFVEELLAAIAEPIMVGDTKRIASASIGIAMLPQHALTPDNLIACADAAMYQAKRQRSHSRCMYDRSMHDAVADRLALEQDLRGAIEAQQLLLQYQPQFFFDSSELWGVEALMRWKHPTRGMVSPVEFIPIAEDTGLIVDIGHWVIDEACRQWTEWNAAGIAPSRIAVNVSQRQFALGDVTASVEAALHKYKMPPSALELEITESCIMDATTDVIGTLGYIRALGVHIAMDDFGTGHSSLSALTQLPIDTLKIDRCFISSIKAGTPNDTIVAAVQMLAENLEVTVVAEGIETELELDRVRWHGCHVGQGYLLSRPLWQSDATALLSQEQGMMKSA